MNHEIAKTSLAVERYLLEEMPAAERNEFEEHYFTCGECAREVAASQAFVSNLTAAGARALVPVRVPVWEAWLERLRPPAWLKPAILQPALAGLFLVVIGTQNFYQIPSLRDQLDVSLAPRPVSDVVLHGPTRAAAQEVRLKAGADLLLTAVLETQAANASYSARIEDKSGRTVVNIAGPFQPKRSILQMLIPRANLGSGEYALVILGHPDEQATQPGAEVHRTTFQLVRE